jgi:hypothetical protein
MRQVAGKVDSERRDEVTRQTAAFYDELPYNARDIDDEADLIRRRNQVAQWYPDLDRALQSATTMLDVGCGAGWLANTAAYHYRVRGRAIDISVESLRLAVSVAQLLETSSSMTFNKPAPGARVRAEGCCPRGARPDERSARDPEAGSRLPDTRRARVTLLADHARAVGGYPADGRNAATSAAPDAVRAPARLHRPHPTRHRRRRSSDARLRGQGPARGFGLIAESARAAAGEQSAVRFRQELPLAGLY